MMSTPECAEPFDSGWKIFGGLGADIDAQINQSITTAALGKIRLAADVMGGRDPYQNGDYQALDQLMQRIATLSEEHLDRAEVDALVDSQALCLINHPAHLQTQSQALR